jgi:hypothetical protein
METRHGENSPRFLPQSLQQLFRISMAEKSQAARLIENQPTQPD